MLSSLGDDVGHRLGVERRAVVAGGAQHPATGARHEVPRRQKAPQLFVLPEIALGVEVLVVPGSGAAGAEGRGVGGPGLSHEPGGVAVEGDRQDLVLPAGLAVHEQAELVLEGARLPRHHHASFSRRLHNPLPLIAPRVHVLLDGDGPPRHQPVHLVLGVLVARHLPRALRLERRRAHLVRILPRDVVAGPPAAGSDSRSYQRFSGQVRPCAVAPEPRAATMRLPSGLHSGFRYSPVSLVIL